MQATQFTHNGIVYTRTHNSKGTAIHKAGPKFVSATAFAEVEKEYGAANSTSPLAAMGRVLAAADAQPDTTQAEASAVAQPMALLAGVVGATAPAPSPANPFAALLGLGTQAAATPKPASTPRTRAPQVNGVARPQGTGACAKVWAICDGITAEGSTPTIAKVKAAGAAQGLDATTVQVQYYRWRKHQGISGRL